MNSNRAAAPFVQINCAAIPDTLIESELFGYEKGSFTGASRDKKGKFQMADGGTLLLDEIGDLSLQAQAKALRAIESGDVEKIGSENFEQIDLRIIAATNKDLKDMVAKGTFREDLYHRVNVIEIHIPPLDQRPSDILPLVDYYLQKSCTKNKIELKQLSPDAQAVLTNHKWEGNVRELCNFVEKMVILTDQTEITRAHVYRLLYAYPSKMDAIKVNTFKEAKESFEQSYLINALISNDWNIARTSKNLKLERSVLYRKIEKYGIQKL